MKDKKYLEGTIESLAFGGEGILRHQGHVIFVPFSLPKETVRVELTEQKKSFARGKIATIIAASANRRTPLCQYFGVCGGCQLQHLAYEQHAAIKKTFVEDALTRLAKLSCVVQDILPNEKQWQYRRHIRLHIKNGRLGYMGNDQQIIAIEQCPIFVERGDIFSLCRKLLDRIGPVLEAEVTIFKGNQERYVLSFSFERLPKNHNLLREFSHPCLQAIVWSDKKRVFRAGNDEIDFSINTLNLTFNAQVFVQAHPEESKALYQKLLHHVKMTKASRVLDLYCGFGATSLLLRLQSYDIFAVEINPESIRLAKVNEQKNHLEGIRWRIGDVEAHLDEAMTSFKPDCVVVNPPRTGLSNGVKDKLLQIRPRDIFYISCMPATLARDLKVLSEHYNVSYVQPFDMFPQTTHVETLVHLSCKN